MNLAPAQTLPATITTLQNRVGAELPPTLAFRDASERSAARPETDAIDQVSSPITGTQDTRSSSERPSILAEAARDRLPTRAQKSAEETLVTAQTGYAAAKTVFSEESNSDLLAVA